MFIVFIVSPFGSSCLLKFGRPFPAVIPAHVAVGLPSWTNPDRARCARAGVWFLGTFSGPSGQGQDWAGFPRLPSKSCPLSHGRAFGKPAFRHFQALTVRATANLTIDAPASQPRKVSGDWLAPNRARYRTGGRLRVSRFEEPGSADWICAPAFLKLA